MIKLDDYKNEKTWTIEHDKDDQLFYIVSRNGVRFGSKFTSRSFAEKALLKHIKMNRTPGPGRKKKEAVKRPAVAHQTEMPPEA